MSTRIIHDSLDIEGNNVADFLILKTDIFNAGTPDACINVEAKILKELPLDVFLILRVEKLNKNKGVYEPTPFGIEKNYCRYMDMDKLVYPLLLKKGNFPSKCPVLPGLYYIRNYTVNPEDLPISVPLGSYKLTFAYRYQDKAVTAIWKGRSIQI